MNKLLSITFCLLVSLTIGAQENTNHNPFRQLGQLLPTPNESQTASGSPGATYWQQRVDYVMNVETDDDNQKLYGHEVLTYHNNSPDVLRCLWLQLD